MTALLQLILIDWKIHKFRPNYRSLKQSFIRRDIHLIVQVTINMHAFIELLLIIQSILNIIRPMRKPGS